MNYAISSLPLALRRMATLAMGAMMALAVVSCDDDTDEPDPVTPPATVSRTLLMYLPWSTDLTNYFYNNISDMKKAIAAQGLDGQRVLVFMCTTATEAQLFELVPDGSGCRQVKLRDYSSPSYTTAEGIASILADVKAEAPAEHYAMTIGCHGMGWVPVSQSRAMRLAPRQGYHWDAGGGPLTRFFGGRTPSVQTDITTLAEGIEGAGMHLDFILFDDCYMSSVEVAYDLRHVTDYLIACPTEIMAYGMPYAEVGPELLGEPDYEAVCSKFLDFYSSYTYPYGTIGVTRTSELDSLARVLRKIEAACDLDASLLPSLQRMDGYRPPIFYDLGDYVSALCTDTALLSEFEGQLDRAVPYKAHTPQYYSAFSGAEDIRAYSGITTSAPTTSSYAADWAATSWYEATH